MCCLSLKATGDEPAKISGHDVNIFILEIFLACSETTSSTIEWALTELLCNPEKLIKAKAELTQVIGPSCRKVEEGDIEKLPYLQENPDVWDDEPALFKPERFIGTKWDCKGQHFEFIPFGSGRRVCAGLPLAHRMLHLTLGMFLHQFDWELGGDVTRGNIDWKDKLGITMRKSEPSLNTWSNGVAGHSLRSSALLDPPEIIEIGSPSASSGPKGWPVLGNMLDLGTMPHRTLTDLGHKFGPAAADLFKNHDLSFEERTINETARVYDYLKGSLSSVRHTLARDEAVSDSGDGGKQAHQRDCFHTKKVHRQHAVGLGGYEFGRRVGVFKEMKGLMEWNGNANVVDFFPWLRWLDPQGLKRKMKRELGKAIQIASKFFKERIQERDVGGEKTMDFLDVLLEFEGDGIDKLAKISDHDLIIFILVSSLFSP
ncbi:hypothetical protein EV1_009338 [Malus domestica]